MASVKAGGAGAGGPPGRWERYSLRSDLVQILRDFRDYRELLYQLTLRDIRIRYKQAVMGFGWALLVPMSVVAAGLVVRFAMAQFAGGGLARSDVATMALKAVVWAFFVGSVSFATGSLTGNMNLVTKIYFPREVLPLSATLAQGFDTTIAGVTLAVLIQFLGVRGSWALLWTPALALLLFLMTATVGLLVSCGNLFFRDVKYLVQVLLMFGIFFTPVMFEPIALGSLGAQLIMLNPLSPILEGLRLCVIEGHDLLQPVVVLGKAGDVVLAWSPWYLVGEAVLVGGGAIAAAVLFHRLEFKFGEYV